MANKKAHHRPHHFPHRLLPTPRHLACLLHNGRGMGSLPTTRYSPLLEGKMPRSNFFSQLLCHWRSSYPSIVPNIGGATPIYKRLHCPAVALLAQNYPCTATPPSTIWIASVVVMDQMEAKGLLTAESIRYQDERQLWSHNQVGSLSSNFQFLTPQGGTKELHQIATNHLLLPYSTTLAAYSCTSALSTFPQEAIKDKRVTLL